MTTEKFETARKLLDRIKHLESVLEFLYHVEVTNHFITMREEGFVSHPLEERIKEEDVPFVILAFEKEKERLKQEFKAL